MAGDEERLRKARDMAHCILQPGGCSQKKSEDERKRQDYRGANMIFTAA